MECVDYGLFDTSPNIAKHTLIDLVPWEVAQHLMHQMRKGRQTVRFFLAQKAHETPELLKLAGELSCTTTRSWRSSTNSLEPAT